MLKRYIEELEEIDTASQTRTIKNINKIGKYIEIDGKKLLNLSSNDYLGIAEDRSIIKEFLAKTDCSFGSASARLLTGTSSTYKKLERLIASLYNKENSLLFNSGYHANIGILSSIASQKDIIFSDKLNHASIIDGMRLSGATFHRYKHLDYDHLESRLQRYRSQYETAIIVTESIFSMDGDIADIKRLVELKEKYNAILIVDEAHAFGVYGQKALGICEEQNAVNDVDIIIATFGKSIGSIGAFATANDTFIKYFTNKARSFIFSTSLPEINVAYSKYIVEKILPSLNDKRIELQKTAQCLREELNKKGLKTIGTSHIVPILFGENNKTIEACNKLIENHFYVLPIRYPTVAKGTSRIRLSLRADISFGEIISITDQLDP